MIGRDISLKYSRKCIVSVSNEVLVKALEYEIMLIKKTGNFNFELIINGNNSFEDRNTDLVLYRISQEALNNIIRHSQATEITIILNYLPDSLEMIIQDNGIGFKKRHSSSIDDIGGTGILNMKARAERLKGSFSIEGSAKVGTLLKVKIPITNETN